jgi:hypothetical protein
MKTKSNNLFNHLQVDRLNELTNLEKEPVAGTPVSDQKIFSAADYWNLNRQRNSTRILRRQLAF